VVVHLLFCSGVWCTVPEPNKMLGILVMASDFQVSTWVDSVSVANSVSMTSPSVSVGSVWFRSRESGAAPF
jgi:hypothetical protein